MSIEKRGGLRFESDEPLLAMHIKKALSLSLSGASPSRGVLDFVGLRDSPIERAHQETPGEIRRKAKEDTWQKRRRWQEMRRPAFMRLPRSAIVIAVLVFFTVSVFSLGRVPLVARAFASIPVVGKAYQDILKQAGLDVAYQAGLVNEIREKTTHDGITLEVIGAFSDGTQTVVYYSITPSDLSTPSWDEVMSGLMLRHSLQELGGRKLGNSTAIYERREPGGGIFGVIKTRQISGIARFLGAKLTLTVEALKPTTTLPGIYQESKDPGPAVYTWSVTFPVQTLTCKPETVAIGKTIIFGSDTHGRDKLVLQELVFAPTQTILRFQVEALPPFPWAKPEWYYLGDCFSLVTAEGKHMRYLGYDLSGKLTTAASKDPASKDPASTDASSRVPAEKRKGEVYFWPTTSRDLSIFFNSLVMEPDALILPLEEGATGECKGGSIAITKIEAPEGATRITLKYTGHLKFDWAWAELIDTADEEPAKSGISPRVVNHLDESSIQYTFPLDLKESIDLKGGQHVLRVSNLRFLEKQGVKVFEMGPEGQ